jgi:mevalonate kinase
MGSGAAVSAAIARALAGFLGYPLEPAVVSRLAFEVDKLHHGTPSGIDNTVVAFGVPVYFVRSETIEAFGVATAHLPRTPGLPARRTWP